MIAVSARTDLITCDDVETALGTVKETGISRKWRSSRYCLIKEGRHYPPKEVLRPAYMHHTHELRPKGLAKGGRPTNTVLKKLEFQVEQCEKLPGCQDWIRMQG